MIVIISSRLPVVLISGGVLESLPELGELEFLIVGLNHWQVGSYLLALKMD